jgi:hypothetical protein
MPRPFPYRRRPDAGKADSKVPMIITIVILAFLGYLVYAFAPIYWTNMKFTQEIKQHLNWDRFYEGATPPTVDSVWEKTRASANKFGLDIPDRDIHVEQLDSGRLKVQVRYKREVTLPVLGKKEVHFEILELQDLE